MSIMYCHNCDTHIDTDWHEMFEYKGEEVCMDCLHQLEEEAEEEINGEDYVKPRVPFDKAQRGTFNE